MDGEKGNEEQDLCQYMCELWSCVKQQLVTFVSEKVERDICLPPLMLNAVLTQVTLPSMKQGGEKRKLFF